MTFKKFSEIYGIKFCKKHHGKMESMWSLSTSVRLNPICQKRAKDEKSICSKCYVYDKEHAKEHNINCGARDCNACRRCYSKNTDIYIKEIVK